MVFRSRQIKNKYRKLRLKQRIISRKKFKNLKKFNWFEFADVSLIKEFFGTPSNSPNIFFFNRSYSNSLKQSLIPFSNFFLHKSIFSRILDKYRFLCSSKSMNFATCTFLLNENVFSLFFICEKSKKSPRGFFEIKINNAYNLFFCNVSANDLFSYCEHFLENSIIHGFILFKTRLIYLSQFFDFLHDYFIFYLSFFGIPFELKDVIDSVDSFLDVKVTDEDKLMFLHSYYDKSKDQLNCYMDDKTFLLENDNKNLGLILPYFETNSFLNISFQNQQIPVLLFRFFDCLTIDK